MGAVTDVVTMADWRRMRMWLLAIAVAIVGANALEAAGLVDLDKTIYADAEHRLGVAPRRRPSFGFGMTLASGCGSKTLIRLGAGNLKSLVVLIVLGISAYMTLKGLFAIWRVQNARRVRASTRRVSAPRIRICGSVLGALTGAGSIRSGLALAVAAAVAAFVFASRDVSREPRR